MTREQAFEEARCLVSQRRVWVHTINRPGSKEEIASLVAVTRETVGVSAITKVYTNPRWRGKRCAERLVRHVTKT
jgi:predicted GNAT family acetyltransferase